MRVRSFLAFVPVLLTACSKDSPSEPDPDPTYTVGGTVSGLEGTGLVLSNNSQHDIAVGNGAFMFGIDYDDHDVYSVSVKTQPTGPAQSCIVTNGTGVIDGTDVTDVEVTCGTPLDNDDLDPGFDEDGLATASLVTGARHMVMMPDGRFVVINEHDVMRFRPDGAPDPTFVGGGRATVDFPGINDRLRGVAVQPDGRIVVVGLTWVQDRAQVGIARMNVNGSIDTDFGVNGAASTKGERYGAEPYDVLIEPGGRIIVGGTSTDGAGDGDFTLFAFLPDGQVDSTFKGGYAHVDMGGRAEIGHAIARQADGRILVAGRVAATGGSDPDVGIARFNPDGSIDTSFGSGGISGTATPWWDEAADILAQPDGRIIVGHLTYTMQPSRFLVMRLLSDGSVDPSFDGDGYGEFPEFSNEHDRAYAATLQPDGRIVVVGQKAVHGTNADFAVARYNVNGKLDGSFGDGGLSAVDFFTQADVARAVAWTPDGGILAAGMATRQSVTLLAMAKFKP